MPSEKLSVNDIRDMVNSDGLGRTIMDVSVAQIGDHYLARKMQEARELILDIEEYIEDNYVPEDLEDEDGNRDD